MARRRRTSLIEDLIEIASRLPWWVSLLIALGSWLILHPTANTPPEVPKDMHQMEPSVAGQLIRTFAFFGQFVLPAVFVIGAIGSVLARAERKTLHANVVNARESGQTIEGISWREFELLVGETFRRKGFTVIEKGGSGPDGGVDLVLHLGTDRYLVQCKQWKALNVGVNVIREFFGVMATDGAAGGFVVSAGRYTAEAKEFAGGRNVQLIDGELLKIWISYKSNFSSVDLSENRNGSIVPETPAPSYPLCSKPMVVRLAKRGPNIGSEFWGVQNFPLVEG
ncbi:MULTISPECIES: restriction endonuclease [Pseudomonas]|uniref:restriction endonuclease n=1 Tax=Pseudomonas nitroreducens TaxID=46680 RepID=UPI001E44B0D8|nr:MULTISPECIES: restriction endonuclease [Pseudomonas]MCE4073570.1 restriction endonuclease [Pseudomonas nitritireducens]MCE4082768.1 restriction endonuclease [Pseudomonas nitroreducens]